MTFLLNLVGFIVVITGLASIATVAGVPQAVILGGATVLLCVAIAISVASSRVGDPA